MARGASIFNPGFGFYLRLPIFLPPKFFVAGSSATTHDAHLPQISVSIYFYFIFQKASIPVNPFIKIWHCTKLSSVLYPALEEYLCAVLHCYFSTSAFNNQLRVAYYAIVFK